MMNFLRSCWKSRMNLRRYIPFNDDKDTTTVTLEFEDKKIAEEFEVLQKKVAEHYDDNKDDNTAKYIAKATYLQMIEEKQQTIDELKGNDPENPIFQ